MADLRQQVSALARATFAELQANKAQAKRLRREAGYVASTPRCGTCLNMQNSISTAAGAATGRVCRLPGCRVEATGLCDWWTGSDGSTLEE